MSVLDSFPSGYVTPAHPLVVLSGLVPDGKAASHHVQEPTEKIGAQKINSESPNVTGSRARAVLKEFLRFESRTDGGHADPSNHAKPMYFRFKSCGRSYYLPRRKSAPAANNEAPPSPLSPITPIAAKARSVLSPLSPGSDLYPDGIMTAKWTRKYLDIVPALFISFFSLTFDPEYKTLHDNRLKNEIFAIRAALFQNYGRIRFVVIILSERSVTDDPEIEERLSSIRKISKLDHKAGLSFIGPDTSPTDMQKTVTSILTDLRSVSLEFYKDMIKHTRRKRDHKTSSGPMLTPADAANVKELSKAGWTARYEFKLGFLSEFCLEIDAANRHYNTAWEALFAFGGFFESVSPRSSRWREYIEFAMILSVRLVRCLLAAGLPTSAVRFWQKHRHQLSQLCRGELIEKMPTVANATLIWARAMAELTREIPEIAMDLNARKAIEPIAPNKRNVYTTVERPLHSDDTVRPWERLHHAGYWLMYCAIRLQSEADSDQRERAKLLGSSLEEATAEFSGRGQARMSDWMKLKLGQQLYQNSHHDAAFKILKLLWQRNLWRPCGWWNLVREVSLSLHRCARKVGDFATELSTLWELTSHSFSPIPDLDYDLQALLDDRAVSLPENLSELHIRQEDIESFLIFRFTFASPKCHAAEQVIAQLHIKSSAHKQCKPLTLSAIHLEIEGDAGQIRLTHDTDIKHTTYQAARTTVTVVRLQGLASGKKTSLVGKCNLTCMPGELLLLNLEISPREADNLKVVRAVAFIDGRIHNIEYSADLRKSRNHAPFIADVQAVSNSTTSSQANQLVVLPKLPRASITFSKLLGVYYTDEITIMEIELTNNEEEPINASLRVWSRGPSGSIAARLNWVEKPAITGQVPEIALDINRSLGLLAVGESLTLIVQVRLPKVQMNCSIEAEVVYSPESNSDDILKKKIEGVLRIVRPFEASYKLLPSLHPDPWPSYFSVAPSMESDDLSLLANSTNIAMRWLLKIVLSSFADDEIEVASVVMKLLRQSKGCTYTIQSAPTNELSNALEPHSQQEHAFILDVRDSESDSKAILPSIDAELQLGWQRKHSNFGNLVTSVLSVPRLTFASQEPRVFVRQSAPRIIGTLLLEVVLENPSTHYLSFSVVLEPSEDFGFSGHKKSTVHLVPLSRHFLQFTLIPFTDSTSIRAPIQVTDIYFNKVLGLYPIGDLQIDETGVLLQIVSPKDEE